MNQDFKNRIVEAIKVDRANYNSNAKQAVSLDINGAQLSRILNDDTDNVLSEAKWFSIARRLDVQLREDAKWVTAKTPVFQFVTAQLNACQQSSLSGLLCDMADLGKTYSARAYAKENKYCVYIDCSQVKTKQKLIREISKELGLGNTGKYSDVYADLVFYLRSIPNPLIILDEAGDLDYPAFLELKALWNATEGCCGWYMMGADGLREKIERARYARKVGYAELFSRFGSKYQKVSPDGKEANDEFTRTQVVMIARANNPEVDVKEMLGKVNGSLRRVKIELQKVR
jgi:DNA transposition AAA+ family ATPase